MRRMYSSFAKINLHLEVLGRRDDGFHRLYTVFQLIDLADRLEISPCRSGVELSVRPDIVPTDSKNLVYQAARAFLEKFEVNRGVSIQLRKRIPTGGGLGGGSSNAATTLMAMREIFGRPASKEDLLPIARNLGADVPYFLFGGLAVGQGRGDEISPLEDLPERGLWLVVPPVQVSTAEVFRRFTPPSTQSEPDAALGARARTPVSWDDVAGGRNDLTETVLEHFPLVRGVYNALVEAEASVVRLSGSGATVFAFFEEAMTDSELAASVPSGSRVFFTRTLNRQSFDRLRCDQLGETR